MLESTNCARPLKRVAFLVSPVAYEAKEARDVVVSAQGSKVLQITSLAGGGGNL
jgi:hypothetical protein